MALKIQGKELIGAYKSRDHRFGLVPSESSEAPVTPEQLHSHPSHLASYVFVNVVPN